MSATESPNYSKSMLRTGIAEEESPHREWPAPICGCCQYEHPYNRRHSRWAAFLYVFLCPALALGDNEAMLQELSSERDGLLGPGCCSGSCTRRQSPEAACASMSLCACCSIMACAWPLLCALTQTQRTHVTKEFRISEPRQSAVQRVCSAACCMPCSLLQVHMLLDECKHELLFSRSWEANSSPFTSRHIYTPPGEESSRIASGAVAQGAADGDGDASDQFHDTASPRSSHGSRAAHTQPSQPPPRSRSSAGSNADIYLTAPSVQSMSQGSNADAGPASPLATRSRHDAFAAQVPRTKSSQRRGVEDGADGAAAATPPACPPGSDPAAAGRRRAQDAAEARSAASTYASSLRHGAPMQNGDVRRSLVDQLRSRAGPEACAALPGAAASPGRTLRRKPAADLSAAGESFNATAGAPRRPLGHVMQPRVTPAGAAQIRMASLDADTAMEAEVPHTVWAASAAAACDATAGDAADALARHGAASHAHVSLSPLPSDGAAAAGGDTEPHLARLHSQGSPLSSGGRRPPRSPRSSLRPSAAYSGAAPVACRSLPPVGSPPLGLGNAVLAPPPSCDTVPMSPSPGPYATMARCQSQPSRTVSERERLEALREGSRARGGMWRQGSAPTTAVAATPTAAEYYRKSSGLHSVGSSDSGAPLSPPALPPMDSAAAALIASEALVAAASMSQGRAPAETQRRLMARVSSIRAQGSHNVDAGDSPVSHREYTTVMETYDDGEQESSTQHVATSSLSSISSTCSSHSRSSTVQGGGTLSSLLSQRGADHFSSFGNPLAQAAAAEATGGGRARGAASVRGWPGGESAAAPAAAAAGRGTLGVGMLQGTALEHHGAVEDSGIVHQESDGAWRVQWRPLAAAFPRPAAPPAHVPRPAAAPAPAPLPHSTRARGGRSVQPIRKWEDALREQGVAAPEASSAQLSVAQLIELHKSTAVSGEPRDAPAAAAHDSFLSDLSF